MDLGNCQRSGDDCKIHDPCWPAGVRYIEVCFEMSVGGPSIKVSVSYNRLGFWSPPHTAARQHNHSLESRAMK